MQHGIKPFAAFGTLLYQLQVLDVPIYFSPYIFVGQQAHQEAVKMNGSGQISLYLPYNKDITDYQWPVENLSLVLCESCYVPLERMRLMALYLLNEGARQVCVQQRDFPSGIEIFNK